MCAEANGEVAVCRWKTSAGWSKRARALACRRHLGPESFHFRELSSRFANSPISTSCETQWPVEHVTPVQCLDDELFLSLSVPDPCLFSLGVTFQQPPARCPLPFTKVTLVQRISWTSLLLCRKGLRWAYRRPSWRSYYRVRSFSFCLLAELRNFGERASAR